MKMTSLTNRRQLLLGSAAFVAAGASVAFSLTGGDEALAQTVSGLHDNIELEDRVLGDVNAPVTIIEYASMTCPHCKSFHDKVLPEIKKNYIDTGKAKLILRPFPFDKDRRGEAAFMLALCAPKEAYYPMLDAIFGIQTALRTSPNVVADLRQITKLAGMSEQQFNDCLSEKNQDTYKKMIDARNRAVRDFKVQSTPTVFVNDKKLGDSTLKTLQEAIEAAL